MEGPDTLFAARAQADVAAGGLRLRNEVFAQIDPELGIGLAEADSRLANDEPGETQRCQHGFVECCAPLEVGNCNRNVVDHFSGRIVVAQATTSGSTTPLVGSNLC